MSTHLTEGAGEFNWKTIDSNEMSLIQAEIARKAGYGDGLNDRWRDHWNLNTSRNTKIEEDLQQLFNKGGDGKRIWQHEMRVSTNALIV